MSKRTFSDTDMMVSPCKESKKLFIEEDADAVLNGETLKDMLKETVGNMDYAKDMLPNHTITNKNRRAILEPSSWKDGLMRK